MGAKNTQTKGEQDRKKDLDFKDLAVQIRPMRVLSAHFNPNLARRWRFACSTIERSWA